MTLECLLRVRDLLGHMHISLFLHLETRRAVSRQSPIAPSLLNRGPYATGAPRTGSTIVFHAAAGLTSSAIRWPSASSAMANS
jgi:hypothetical protein